MILVGSNTNICVDRGSWDKNLVTLYTMNPVVKMKFHQFETHLAMTNGENLIRCVVKFTVFFCVTEHYS